MVAGAAVVALAAAWRTAAALALAANITGLLSLVISRSTPAGGLTVTDVVAALAALATVVGLSAIVAALRQPPRLLDLAPAPAGTGPAEHGEPLGRGPPEADPAPSRRPGAPCPAPPTLRRERRRAASTPVIRGGRPGRRDT